MSALEILRHVGRLRLVLCYRSTFSDRGSLVLWKSRSGDGLYCGFGKLVEWGFCNP